MQDLKQSSKKQLTAKQLKLIMIAILIIAIIGFIDATHLTISHFNGSELNCGVNGGCNTVTTSKWSTIFGLPTALFGSLYYLFIAFMSFYYLQNKKDVVIKILKHLPIAGFLMSLWFVYLQLFVIHAICIYCMGSAATSTILFGLGQYLRIKQK